MHTEHPGDVSKHLQTDHSRLCHARCLQPQQHSVYTQNKNNQSQAVKRTISPCLSGSPRAIDRAAAHHHVPERRPERRPNHETDVQHRPGVRTAYREFCPNGTTPTRGGTQSQLEFNSPSKSELLTNNQPKMESFSADPAPALSPKSRSDGRRVLCARPLPLAGVFISQSVTHARSQMPADPPLTAAAAAGSSTTPGERGVPIVRGFAVGPAFCGTRSRNSYYVLVDL